MMELPKYRICGSLDKKNWENDKKMTLEFELDKMGSPISTWTNKG